MKLRSGLPHHRRKGQQGYIMMALALTVALTLIALAAGAPAISADLRRQREEELIHRGVQYARAIRLYHRRFGTYPLTVDQLVETNHLHFLRKRYSDPMTGSDFQLLHPGDVLISMRQFGVPFTPPDQQDSNGSPSENGQSNHSSSPFIRLSQIGATGDSTGGGPIIGVASTSDQQSFHVFNNKHNYNGWQFVYAPALDRGGLITRPYDGVLVFDNRVLPNSFPGAGTGGGDPNLKGSPGVPLPPNSVVRQF